MFTWYAVQSCVEATKQPRDLPQTRWTFCVAETAGQLCSTSRVEWLNTWCYGLDVVAMCPGGSPIPTAVYTFCRLLQHLHAIWPHATPKHCHLRHMRRGVLVVLTIHCNVALLFSVSGHSHLRGTQYPAIEGPPCLDNSEHHSGI